MLKFVCICMIFLVCCDRALSSENYYNHANAVSQYSTSVSASNWPSHSLEPRDENIYQIAAQVPQLISSSVSALKSLPYVEVLKLIENFIRFKGKIGNILWQLWSDNAHIIAAVQTTIIKAIPTIHNFTLSAVIILRKTLEFFTSSMKAGGWA